MLSADSLRKSWEEHGRFAAIEPVMTISEAGLVLGAGTVLAKRVTDSGGPSLAIAGSEESILALLTIAYGRSIDPSVIGHIRRAVQAYARGETHLARIHLAYTRLPSLDDEARASYRLFLADALLNDGLAPRELLSGCGLDSSPLDALKAGFDPAEPRVPAGNPDGGQWTTEGADPEIVPAAARRPASQGGDPNAFFDTVYDKFHALAERLGINETWLLGLAAHESWYLEPHNRTLNNPFGVTHGGGSNVHYDSIDAAIAYWERRFGPVVKGATSAQDFVNRLFRDRYNTDDPKWRAKVLGVIRSIPLHLSAWRARREI